MQEDPLAEKEYTAAIELNQKNPKYYQDRALLLMYANRIQEAFKDYEMAKQLDPKDSSIIFDIGKAYQVTNNITKAIEYFKKAYELDPKNSKACYQIATYSKDTEEQIKLFKEVIKLDPKHVDAHYNLGVALVNKDKVEEASKYFLEGTKLAPTDPQMIAKLAQCYDYLGKEKERLEQREKLITLVEDGKWKQNRYCCAQFACGKYYVFAHEFFKLEGDFPLKYLFQVTEDRNKPLFNISLGSYKLTNDIHRESGLISEDERVFHLDGYYPNNEHKTFAFYKGEPMWNELKEFVKKVS